MSAAEVHLLLNHIPILGSLFGLLLCVYGTKRRSDDVKRAALWTFIITGIITVPVYLSGDGAAEIVGGLPGVSIDLVERHDNAATITLIAIESLAVVSLICVWLLRVHRELRSWIGYAVLLLALVASGLAVWTGSLGGRIRHTEVRSGFSK